MGMRRVRGGLGALMAVLVTVMINGGAVAQADGVRVWPIRGPVVRGFDPPAVAYGAGHRGIDIAGPAGTPVVAAAAGTVTFVGTIDYVQMVTVTHAGGVRTTYQPVAPAVASGAKVSAGQVIGVLLSGHADKPCLHFGVLRGDTYLDPVAWLARRPVRLLPDGTAPASPLAASPPDSGGGWPVVGPVTSAYGWRMHPILQQMLFHDGIDIAAACGTPVVTPWAGTVVEAGYSSTMGNYVRVSHAGGLVTTYMHLSSVTVRVGDGLAGGHQVGLVGTTGLSTGCHLHFGASRNGVSIDPRPLLP